MGLQILGYWHQLPVSQCMWKHRWWDKFIGWDCGPRPCWCLENLRAPKLKDYSKWSMRHCCSFSFLVKPDQEKKTSPFVALSFPFLTLGTAFHCHSVFKFFSERLLFSSPLPVFSNEAMSYINQRLWRIIEPSLNNVVHSCSRAVPNHAGLALTLSYLPWLSKSSESVDFFIILLIQFPAACTCWCGPLWPQRDTLHRRPPRQDLEFMQHEHACTPVC